MDEKKEYVKLWLSYEAYFEAYGAAEVGRLVLAMLKYRSSGVEPEFTGSERFIWPAIKRDIDEAINAQAAAAAAHRESGRSGGRPARQNQKGYGENQNNQKGFGETNLPQGQGTMDSGHGQGQGQDITRPRGDAAEIQQYYRSRINPSCSQTTLDLLAGYVETLGPEVCRRSLDVAIDEKKTSWSYIRAILQDKETRGIRSLADWDADVEKRQSGKKSGGEKDISWMKQFLPNGGS